MFLRLEMELPQILLISIFLKFGKDEFYSKNLHYPNFLRIKEALDISFTYLLYAY